MSNERHDSLDELIAEAELGQEARSFVEGNLGKCMVGIARQELEAARIGMDDVDPENTIRIRELQNEIWRAKKFEEWLAELVTKGDQALIIYKQQEANT